MLFKKNFVKTIILSILCMVSSITTFSQDSTFYTEKAKKVRTLDSASYYFVRYKDKADTNSVVSKMYNRKGELQMVQEFRNKKLNGKTKEYFPDGMKKLEIDYVNDKKEGLHLGWWPNGQLKRKDTYVNDVWKEGVCYSSTGKDTAHFQFQVSPSFPGGSDSLRRFLYKTVRYPNEERLNEVQGTVRIAFVVDKDGTVTNPEVNVSVSPALDKEALRVVKAMPKWIPGFMDGEPAKFRYILPVVFMVQ